MDANAHHSSWNSHVDDDDGRSLLKFIRERELSVKNTWKENEDKGYGTTYIDVKLCRP